MIVLDASTLFADTGRDPGGGRLFRNDEEFHSPHLVDIEVTQGLRTPRPCG